MSFHENKGEEIRNLKEKIKKAEEEMQLEIEKAEEKGKKKIAEIRDEYNQKFEEKIIEAKKREN